MNIKDEVNQKKIMYWTLWVTFIILLFNTFQISNLEGDLFSVKDVSKVTTSANKAASNTNLLTGQSKIIPKGIPEVYGKELQFSYDDIDPYDAAKANNAIEKFSNFDRTLNLEGSSLDRYVKLLYEDYGGMSCEFCCGARSVIFENGEAACGCAHSYAMRGLTKYLLTNHPDMSDEEILEEVGKFKVLFFPTTHEAKAQMMEEKGIDVNYISLTTNINRGIEKGAQTGGAMVGGC
ncbi:MAG: hypothetical protein Q8Q42_02715 [Nanoarchaeota archaeon]|nr:hypothetical protein [Nanoarchaeota archaeon]